eukprot:CCRYP_019938-RA/>CCRYP_019938-RA protein AED:0.15 eAED:0.15 QI:0/0/0/1/0/0/2/0/180
MSCFGAEPEVVADLWTRIDPEKTMPRGAKAEHIMWTLYCLKIYSVEEVNIQNILWEKQYKGDICCPALVTIAGTDMPVQHKFDPKFCSHKFRSNRLKYEVGVCIQSGNIVWVNGPFRGGENDLNIACQAVISALEDRGMVEADGGYAGKEFYIKIPKDAKTEEHRHIKAVTRSRHETANN